MPLYRQHEFSVRRRYKDFLWCVHHNHCRHARIHDMLCVDFQTMLVPALPEKGITTLGKQRFDEEFVERRRRELERFIQRVCSHPMLKYCRHLQAFLEAPELTDVAEGYPLSKTDEMFKVFSGFGVAISKVASNTEMDDFLKNEMKYVANVEKEMHMMETSCGKMVQRRKELADSLRYGLVADGSPSLPVKCHRHIIATSVVCPLHQASWDQANIWPVR